MAKEVIRCPYCVEHGQFRPMIPHGTGSWWMCARCGHIAMPSNPNFKCTCTRCEQEQVRRGGK